MALTNELIAADIEVMESLDNDLIVYIIIGVGAFILMMAGMGSRRSSSWDSDDFDGPGGFHFGDSDDCDGGDD